jgi:hypothetical protein
MVFEGGGYYARLQRKGKNILSYYLFSETFQLEQKEYKPDPKK